MAQQTAVEWLITEIDAQFTHINIRWKEEMIDKAKQMQKEQAFVLFKAGQDSMEEGGKNFEQFYLKYYGKTNGS